MEIDTFPSRDRTSAPGARGPAGGVTFPYQLEAGTSAPPADGKLRFNSANHAVATHIFISKEDLNAVDLEDVLSLIGVDTVIKIFSERQEWKYLVYLVLSVSDGGDYFDIEVDFLAGGAAIPNGTRCCFAFSRRGQPAPVVTRVRKKSDIKVNGDTLLTSSAAQLSGISVTFTLPTEQDVALTVGATAYNQGGGLMAAEIGCKVDSGSYQPITKLWIGNGADSDGTGFLPLPGHIILLGLAAGSHTITLWGKSPTHSAASDSDSYILGSTDFPVSMTVFYEDAE